MTQVLLRSASAIAAFLLLNLLSTSGKLQVGHQLALPRPIGRSRSSNASSRISGGFTAREGNGGFMYYKGVDGSVFGPFTSAQMLHWWHEGYFPPGVPVSNSPSGPFRSMDAVFVGKQQDPGSVIVREMAPRSATATSATTTLTTRSLESGPDQSAAGSGLFQWGPTSASTSISAAGTNIFGKRSFLTKGNILDWGRVDIGGWRELLTQQFNRDVNPAFKYYVTSINDSVAQTAWKYALAATVINIFQHVLVLKLLALLIGLVAREFLLSQRQSMHASPLVATVVEAVSSMLPYTCPIKANPYSAQYQSTGVSVYATVLLSIRTVINQISEHMASYRGSVLITVALLVCMTMVVNPILTTTAQASLSMRHLERQLHQNWQGDLKSKYNFREEAAHSLSLTRSFAGGILVLIGACSAAVLLSSMTYALVAFFISVQLISLIFAPPSTERFGKMNSLIANKSLVAKHNNALSHQVDELERVLTHDDDNYNAVIRWPTLLTELLSARKHSLKELFVGTAVTEAAIENDISVFLSRKRITEFAVQFIAMVYILVRNWSTNDMSSELKLGGNLPNFFLLLSRVMKGWVMTAFSDKGMTHIHPHHALLLFSVGRVVWTMCVLSAPLLLWHIATTLITTAHDDITTLEDLWSTRSLPTNQPPHVLFSQPETGSRIRSGGGILPGEMPSDTYMTDGPAKEHGITLDRVTAVGSGRVRLRDISVHIPPGKLTLLIGARSAQTDIDALLGVIWRGNDAERSSGNSDGVFIQKGAIKVHGREIKDWSLAALRNKIIYMKDTEAPVPITLGVLCGLGIDHTMEGAERQRTAALLSGIAEVEKVFRAGFKTNMGTVLRSSLTTDQWRRIYLCRALCQWNKDIVLLQGPTQHMSELEEKRFLEAIKGMIRPDQVVLVSSVRHESARYADHALLFERGVGIRVLDPGRNQ